MVEIQISVEQDGVRIVGEQPAPDVMSKPYKKFFAVGTGFVVKGRGDNIEGSLNWLRTATRQHKSMSVKDREFVAQVMGTVVTLRYFF